MGDYVNHRLLIVIVFVKRLKVVRSTIPNTVIYHKRRVGHWIRERERERLWVCEWPWRFYGSAANPMGQETESSKSQTTQFKHLRVLNKCAPLEIIKYSFPCILGVFFSPTNLDVSNFHPLVSSSLLYHNCQSGRAKSNTCFLQASQCEAKALLKTSSSKIKWSQRPFRVLFWIRYTTIFIVLTGSDNEFSILIGHWLMMSFRLTAALRLVVAVLGFVGASLFSNYIHLTANSISTV